MFTEDAISVELDHLNIVSGDKITGRVILQLKKARGCTVRVELGWDTVGSGNSDSDVLESKDLFTGDLEPGIHSFPFALEAPNGPFSYQGTNMGIRWSVKGRADIPWKIDPKASAIFTLAPGSVEHVTYPVAMGAISGQLDEDTTTNMVLGVIGIVLLLAGATTLAINMVTGICLIILGVILVALGFRTIIAKKKLENIQLTFDPEEVRAGAAVIWQASYTPKPNVRINHAKVVFTCREIVTSGTGKSRTTRYTIIHLSEQQLPLTAQPRFKGVFNPPHVYSLALINHQLRWTVGFHVDIANWPDYKVETEFVVLPPFKQLEATESSIDTDGIW